MTTSDVIPENQGCTVDFKEILEAVWPQIVSYRSELIASLALLISCVAARIAWRNARAAEIQAEAATVQADAALNQAGEAQHALTLSYTANEVQALEAARTRIDLAAPRAVVSVELVNEHPIVTDDWPDRSLIPHPPVQSPGEIKLDYKRHKHDYIYYILRGWLRNDGDQTTRFLAGGSGMGPIFYAGADPVGGGGVAVPWKSNVDQHYILPPGGVALFELRAIASMWDLLHDEGDKVNPYPLISRFHFSFLPGNLDGPMLSVTISVEGETPVWQEGKDEKWDAPILVRGSGHVHVHVDRKLKYPKNFDYVHAELKDDKDALEQMRSMDRIIESMKDERKGK